MSALRISMRRAAVFTALLCSFADRASAHGPPPTATELLAVSAQDAALVRLAPGGFAHRVADGFRFICPEAWGGDVLAPAAAIPLGPALVASDTLFVVEQAGRVAPHPLQTGVGTAVASHADAVFAIFDHNAQYELRRVTAITNDLLRVLDQPFGALAASDSELSLLRWLDKTLTLQRVSLTGELLATTTWTVPSAVAYARLHVANNQVYVLVWGRSAPWVTLGRMGASGYEPLRGASTDIAGPVSLSTGSLVALDGALQNLETGAAIDTLGNRVTCLGEIGSQPFACAHGDLLRVDANGLGAPLFELSQLREPDDQNLSAEERNDCTVRWTDLKTDAATARAARLGFDASVSATTNTSDAGTPAAGSPGGCAAGPSGTAPPWWVGMTALSLLCLRRRSAQR